MEKREITETLKGTIENVVYRNENNDYTVLEIVDGEDNLITAVGVIPLAFEGEIVALKGRWTYHKEFGKQFAFDSFEKSLPDDVDGIFKYLSSGTIKGVGPVTALKIVNRFGVDSFDVIEHRPEWLADISGITRKKAVEISKSFCEQSGIRGVMMFCKDFIGPGEIGKVYKKFGAGAVGIIKENPYVLCDGELGIPFAKADAIAKSLGLDLDSKHRVKSGIIYILSHSASGSGHTCLPRQEITGLAIELLQISEERINTLIDALLNEGEISCYKKVGVEFIMTNETAEDEDTVARNIKRLSDTAGHLGAIDIHTLIEKVELGSNINFAPMQREALLASLENGVITVKDDYKLNEAKQSAFTFITLGEPESVSAGEFVYMGRKVKFDPALTYSFEEVVCDTPETSNVPKKWKAERICRILLTTPVSDSGNYTLTIE